MKRRAWRGRLVILPAKVQGEGAAAEMAGQIQVAAKLGRFDLLVIGRGGGSLEDLWAFNEEVLVRAVAGSPIPIVSAVGHEIDFTLCDFAADQRAETPSAAAELISSRYVACVERVAQAAERLWRETEDQVQRGRRRVDHARSRLRLLSPAARLEQGYLKLDDSFEPPRRGRRPPPAGSPACGGPAPVRARPPFARTPGRAGVAPAAGLVEAPAGGESAIGFESRFCHRAGRRGHARDAARCAAGAGRGAGGVCRRHGPAQTFSVRDAGRGAAARAGPTMRR
jgi:hypothetical protein